MSLEHDIRAWDGKSAHDIATVFDRYRGSARVASRLIALAQFVELERGATWLLKRGIETGEWRLSAPSIDAFYGLADSLSDWGACLHLMQCMPHAPVPKAHAKALARFLDWQLTDRRAIVRAWAYWGYHELAEVCPQYAAEAESLLLDAARSERAGSVRVRVRRALEARSLA